MTTRMSKENFNNRFGGVVYDFDFDTTSYQGTKEDPPAFYGSMIASRIAQDMRFDEKCLKEARLREERNKYSKK